MNIAETLSNEPFHITINEIFAMIVTLSRIVQLVQLTKAPSPIIAPLDLLPVDSVIAMSIYETKQSKEQQFAQHLEATTATNKRGRSNGSKMLLPMKIRRL